MTERNHNGQGWRQFHWRENGNRFEYGVKNWCPWLALPDKIARLLRLDPEHIDQYYNVSTNAVTGVFKQSFKHDGVLYHCFYVMSYLPNNPPTWTTIYFDLKSADPIPLNTKTPFLKMENIGNEQIKFTMVKNHYCLVRDKNGNRLSFFGGEEAIKLFEFVQTSLHREGLVNAKSDLWNLAIPGLGFQEEFHAHEDGLEPGSLNPCVYASKEDNGTVFIQFSQEGRYRRLKRLTENELTVEITDAHTKKPVLFWTGYTIVCLHFRHRILNPDLF